MVGRLIWERGQRAYENSLLSTQFNCEPKTALIKRLFKKSLFFLIKTRREENPQPHPKPTKSKGIWESLFMTKV